MTVCACKFKPNGTPDGLCLYHEKWAKALGKHSRDETLKQIYEFLATRGMALKMQDRTDDALLILALEKELRDKRSPIRVGLLKLEDRGDLKR